ncbi:MAG: helix-turn-helix domain-containing protein [Paludibacteraceae bacterium]|nr:helix-turn-helix domain-containing protein [Paludibacteraceae bacterium]
MLDRIKQIKRQYHITSEQLAAASGVSVWALTKQLQGAYKLNIDVVLSLLRMCPDISADWLLFGTEPMTKKDIHAIYDKLCNIEKKMDNIAKT